MDKTHRILVVEDEPDFVRLLTLRLKSWGYEVRAVPTGQEAIQSAQEDPPDLILLDIRLPQMKGQEVCAKLKSDPKTKEIPIIFLSALGMAGEIKKGLDLGAEDYIVKPFDAQELNDRIWVCLQRRR